MNEPCREDVEGRHAWWYVYRFPWPIGLVFPKVRRCLFCGECER